MGCKALRNLAFWTITLSVAVAGFQAIGGEPDSRLGAGKLPVYKGNAIQSEAGVSGAMDSPAIVKRPSSAAKADATDGPVANSAQPAESSSGSLETTSFKGVTPGVSTKADVLQHWGQPKQTGQSAGNLAQLYAIGPFSHVEVRYADDKVAAIIVHLDHASTPDAIAKQLGLTSVRQVVVVDDFGEAVGVAFPERGVSAIFEHSGKQGDASMKASQLVLEPLSAEPFVLRAENEMSDHIDLSARDLKQALDLDQDNGRAYWLLSRILLTVGQADKAVKATQEALRIDPNNPQYRITHAQAMAQLGHPREALAEVQKVAASKNVPPHLRGKALSLAGNLLASGPNPDLRKAMAYHTQAIQLVSPLIADPHPDVRIAVKEVLIDAHVGVAFDVAWGEYKDKASAVPQWLSRATSLATDLMDNEHRGPDQLFHVFTRSLAVYVGVREGINPTPAVDAVGELGEKMLAKARGNAMRAHVQAEIGTSLYDAVQVYQMRSESDQASKCGEVAAKYLADSIATQPSNNVSLLLGRLYFRLGDIEATRSKDFKTAVRWYDKAVPLFDRVTPAEIAGDLSRVGYCYARMGGAYWSLGDREKAVKLTQKGVKLMEQAVQQGEIESSALAKHYSNLAAMHRALGMQSDAERYQQLAARVKTEKLK